MQRLALGDNKGWNRTDRKSCFPMSLTSLSSSRDRNKYGGRWRRSVNFFKRYSLCYCYRPGLFQKYHKTLSLSIKSLHKQCFYFLLQPREVPGENGNNVYAKFWRRSKDYYGIIESVNAIYRRVLLFVCSMNISFFAVTQRSTWRGALRDSGPSGYEGDYMNITPPYLFRSREVEDDVREEKKIRLVELHPLLCNACPMKTIAGRHHCSFAHCWYHWRFQYQILIRQREAIILYCWGYILVLIIVKLHSFLLKLWYKSWATKRLFQTKSDLKT